MPIPVIPAAPAFSRRCRLRTSCRPREPAGRRNASASKEDKAASPKGAPISLAAAREEALRKLPVDRSKYQAVKTLAELNAFIARVHDAGQVAIEIKANSID